MLSLMAVLALGVAACTGSVDETGNGAIASLGDESESASGNDQSQTSVGVDVISDASEDAALPAEAETGVGDDPAVGSADPTDGAETVVVSEDGLSSEPAANAAEPENTPDAAPAGPAMPASAAEICAVVEFGYLGLLDGDSGADVQARLREGASTAAALDDVRYAEAGADLVAAIGSDDMSSRADELLSVCAADGFERLA